MKLTSGNINVMNLALRDKDADGWTKVSKIVWPIVEILPVELVELKPNEAGGGHIRITPAGEIVLRYS